MKQRTTFHLFIGVLVLALFLFMSPTFGEMSELYISGPVVSGAQADTTVKLLLVGDVMLGRVVENVIERNGFSYIFAETQDLMSDSDAVVGNFEGIVNEEHLQTRPFAFSFSIKEDYLKQLKSVGFTTLSLANNHAFDFGAESLAYTRKVCVESGMLCVGDPNKINEFSIAVQDVGGYKIGYLFLHAIVSLPHRDEYLSLLNELDKHSDYVVVYIHWGDEYIQTHSKNQEILAHELIDDGVDVVIGHHPHVVQDIEIYKSKPIFYSLGNFIFDQYFSEEVRTGLGVQVEFSNSGIVYNIIDFYSSETSTQPRIRNIERLETFLLKNQP